MWRARAALVHPTCRLLLHSLPTNYNHQPPARAGKRWSITIFIQALSTYKTHPKLTHKHSERRQTGRQVVRGNSHPVRLKNFVSAPPGGSTVL
uniref:Uncharacterized protein n=1 Tax=Anopheles aquasalis TaxID=42839 RepID=T1DP03_ANOAQ